MVINGNFFLKKIMKKTYMTPVAEEVKLNYQYSLLAGSLLDTNDEATIVDDIDIVDTGGLLDPESPEFFDFDDDF